MTAEYEVTAGHESSAVLSICPEELAPYLPPTMDDTARDNHVSQFPVSAAVRVSCVCVLFLVNNQTAVS